MVSIAVDPQLDAEVPAIGGGGRQHDVVHSVATSGLRQTALLEAYDREAGVAELLLQELHLAVHHGKRGARVAAVVLPRLQRVYVGSGDDERGRGCIWRDTVVNPLMCLRGVVGGRAPYVQRWRTSGGVSVLTLNSVPPCSSGPTACQAGKAMVVVL